MKSGSFIKKPAAPIIASNRAVGGVAPSTYSVNLDRYTQQTLPSELRHSQSLSKLTWDKSIGSVLKLSLFLSTTSVRKSYFSSLLSAA